MKQRLFGPHDPLLDRLGGCEMRTRRRDRRWHAMRRAERSVHQQDGVTVVSLGEAAVWDTGDLVRLREVASAMTASGRSKVALDLAHVSHLPSGFMNMLCEWREYGFEVLLLDPQPFVQNMLWFQRFTEPVSATDYRLNYMPQKDFRRRERHSRLQPVR